MTNRTLVQHGFILPIIVVLMLGSIVLWQAMMREPTEEQVVTLEKQAELIYFWQQATLNYIAATGLNPLSVANLLNAYELSPELATDELTVNGSLLAFDNYRLNFTFARTSQLEQQLDALAPHATREFNQLGLANLHIDKWKFTQHLQPRQASSQTKKFLSDLDMAGNPVVRARRVLADVLLGDVDAEQLISVSSQSQLLTANELKSENAQLSSVDLVAQLTALAAFNQTLKACLAADGTCRY